MAVPMLVLLLLPLLAYAQVLHPCLTFYVAHTANLEFNKFDLILTVVVTIPFTITRCHYIPFNIGI